MDYQYFISIGHVRDSSVSKKSLVFIAKLKLSWRMDILYQTKEYLVNIIQTLQNTGVRWMQVKKNILFAQDNVCCKKMHSALAVARDNPFLGGLKQHLWHALIFLTYPLGKDSNFISDGQ